MKEMTSYRIIDFHVHVFADKIAEKATKATCDHYRFPSEVAVGDLAHLRQSIEGFRVEKMVVHSTATKPAQVRAINDFLLGLDDARFVPFATMHPDFALDIEEELATLKIRGMKGIKLHTDFQGFDADDPKAYPIYRAAEKLDLPVLFHVGDRVFTHSHPKKIAKVSEDFPYLRIVAAHFGGREQWEDGLRYLKDCPNVWFDSSSAIGMLGAAGADKMIEAYGYERIFFATDFPMASLEAELKRFFYLDLTQTQREAILYTNAKRFLNL